eukprot:245035-Pelagomonas_calceolata.AAC.1
MELNGEVVLKRVLVGTLWCSIHKCEPFGSHDKKMRGVERTGEVPKCCQGTATKDYTRWKPSQDWMEWTGHTDGIGWILCQVVFDRGDGACQLLCPSDGVVGASQMGLGGLDVRWGWMEGMGHA